MRVVDRKSCRECKNRVEFEKPDDNQVNRCGPKFAFGTKRSRVRISPLRFELGARQESALGPPALLVRS